MVDFFFWFWAKDQGLVPALIEGIREHYPDSGIVAVSDGEIHPSMPTWLSSLGVKFAATPERKKLLGNCEDYLLNGYRCLLELSSADRFIQVDPDSAIRRAAAIPEVDWAGQIFWNSPSGVKSTVGAGEVFSRQLVERLVKHLESLPDDARTDFRYKDGTAPTDDSAVGHHLNLLGFSPVPWVNDQGFLEVRLQSSYSPGLNNDRWAITHPVAPTEDAMIDPLMALSGGVQMQAMQLITQAFRSGRTFRHG